MFPISILQIVFSYYDPCSIRFRPTPFSESFDLLQFNFLKVASSYPHQSSSPKISSGTIFRFICKSQNVTFEVNILINFSRKNQNWNRPRPFRKEGVSWSRIFYSSFPPQHEPYRSNSHPRGFHRPSRDSNRLQGIGHPRMLSGWHVVLLCFSHWEGQSFVSFL